MPRPRHAMGRPGTVVIPPDWEATHALVVDKTLDCTVTVGPAGVTPQWVEARKQTETAPGAPAYVGPASVTPIEQDTGQTVDAQDVVPTSVYQVKLHHTAATVLVDHVVTISAAPDPALVGRRLRVVAVEKGSRRFSRILTAVDAD